MLGRIDARLAELEIDIEAPVAPVANYVPYVISGGHVYISGQVPITVDGFQYQGKVGSDFSVLDGQNAARLCAVNLLAQLKAACNGDLDRVRRCIKLGGFVNAVPSFEEHPTVINGASDLMVEVFGDAGRHARFAVGAPSLPFNVAVEIDGIFEIA